MSVLVTGAGYLVSKYESKCKEKYEKIRQSQNDKMADSLYYVIHRISFSKMYEAADKSGRNIRKFVRQRGNFNGNKSVRDYIPKLVWIC